MRDFARTITVGLAVLAAISLFSIPQAFAAKASFDSPPGEPPYGLAVHGNAGGTKLYGTIEIEYINQTSALTADVRAVVRLRKGNTVKVFYSGILEDVNIDDPKVLQDVVAFALAPKILNAFFPGESLCIWLKAASELGESQKYSESGSTFQFEMMDVEIAVNTCQ